MRCGGCLDGEQKEVSGASGADEGTGLWADCAGATENRERPCSEGAKHDEWDKLTCESDRDSIKKVAARCCTGGQSFCPRTSDWGKQEYADCGLPYTWGELLHKYKDDAEMFKSGGLGKLMEWDGYETWQCIRDHHCANDPLDPWFCFVYHETKKVFTPWGHNSDLKLVEPA